MLESANFEAEFLGDAEEHQDFVFAVAMRVNVALAFQHLNERLKAQIAARGNEIFLAGSSALFVVVPGFLVIAGLAERATDGFFDAHARGRIAFRLAGNAEIRALGIFTERELDARHRAFERELRHGLAPAELDDQSLSADGIGGAVQNVR